MPVTSLQVEPRPTLSIVEGEILAVYLAVTMCSQFISVAGLLVCK